MAKHKVEITGINTSEREVLSSEEMDELFRKMLLEAARDAGVTLRLIEERRAAPDHPVAMAIPETDYLKFYLLQIV